MTAPRWLPPTRTRSRMTRDAWRAHCTRPFPPELAAAVLERAAAADREAPAAERTSPEAPGNRLAGATRAELDRIPWDTLDSDAALRDWAERLALRVAWAVSAAPDADTVRARSDFGGLFEGRDLRLRAAEAVADSAGIAPPPDHLPQVGRIARLACPRWWRRRLRAAWHRRAEDALRRFGLVHRGAAPYVTHWTRRRRRGQRRVMLAALQAAVIENEAGEQLELFELWKGSTANPAVRRHELMARLRGFERIASELGHVARFYTLTAPAAFHPWTTAGGELRPNPNYNDSTVTQAREWLQKMWSRVRAKLKRLSVLVYGFRIAEPHHDGTPHWHALLWVPEHDADRLDFVIRGHFLAEYGDEPGAERHRVKVEAIDPAKGSAVGYVAKYVAKNVDGHATGSDFETGGEAHSGARRAEAWATVHRIRQFQQIGGPPVGLWRELRRMRTPHASEPIERARSAADAGDWAGFIRALGGLEACRGGPVALWTERTGELTRYGEPRGPVVAGVLGPEGRVRTRLHSWRVRWGARSGALPWTRGNNCTEGSTDVVAKDGSARGRTRVRRRAKVAPGGAQATAGRTTAPGPSAVASVGLGGG